jgi:hypothetical protein
MNTKKLLTNFTYYFFFAVAPSTLAQTLAPVTENVKYDFKVAASQKDQLALINLWMYNKSTGNPISQFAQYPQLTASMIINDGYLYITKFKEIVPSKQQLYVYNARTGEYYGLVDIEGLDTEEYNMRLFEDIGRVTNGSQDTYIMSGYNSRYYSTDYPEFLESEDNRRIYFGYLDFPDPMKPTVSDMISCQLLPDLTNRDQFMKAYTVNDFSVRYSKSTGTRASETYPYSYSASQFNDVSKYSTKDLSKSDLNCINARTGLYEEIFKYKSSSGGLQHYTYSVNLVPVFTSDASFNVKSTQLVYNTSIFKTIVNRSDNGTTLNNPVLAADKSLLNSYPELSDPLPLDETAIHTGNAVAMFKLNGDAYIVYASRADKVTRFRLVSFPNMAHHGFDGSELLWEFPKNGFETTDLTTESGENITGIAINKSTIGDYEVADIYLYAQGQGLAAYRVGPANTTTGILDVESNDNSQVKWALTNRTLVVSGAEQVVDIYNLQGTLVLKSQLQSIDLSDLQTGVYIARAGASVYKFILK